MTIFLKGFLLQRKMKVAHFINTSGVYGAERWILGLLNNLKEIDSLIISTNFDSPALLQRAKKQKIQTRSIKIKGNFAIFDAANKLKNLIKKENIDILHTHGYKENIIGLFAAKKAKIKIISTPHGWSKDAGLKLKFYEAADRFFLRFFDLVCPHTLAFKSSLKHIKRIKYINNFVDLKTIPKPKKGNPKLITYMGQLIERKRVQDLILALKYQKDVKLQIIGHGMMAKDLVRLVKKLKLEKRIKFLGFREDRLKLLNNSQILVLPSLLEWIPRVAMEAMAVEKIVITTNIQGNRFLIKHKETGLLVPVKSPKKIAEAINYTLKNKKQSELIAKKGKNLIKKEFSAERAAEEYEKTYISLLN